MEEKDRLNNEVNHDLNSNLSNENEELKKAQNQTSEYQNQETLDRKSNV
jgi:hypothetical protein